MKRFQKKASPKSLSINEMWNLYRILEPSIPAKDEYLLIDELDRMMDKLSSSQFHQALEIMYGRVDMNLPPVQLLLMFTSGIKSNDLFKFHDVIKAMNGSSNR